ncbi:hypothetical protein [Limosilactobacillus reuteri]|uniref:hypothetical protein n=1 Tax=Limosilactobacillus reuteri TaxID=1598 RepID=UPI001E3E2CB6|nr:hypothetical protein [Limosilactobacillus reuteri]MCC4501817.1 hypothetical protein [Limosilactobacillus reuteri]
MNTTYNYLDALINDITDAINDHDIDFEWDNFIDDNGDLDADYAIDSLNDVCWDSDFITGNGSGSYTMSKSDAEKYLAGNFDLLAEAVKDLQNNDASILSRGAESCDVLIRLYLLPQAVDIVVNDKLNNL